MYKYVCKMSLIFCAIVTSISIAQAAPSGIGCDWDRACDATDGSCLKFYDSAGQHVYTIKAFAGCDGNTAITPILNTNWPETVNGEKVFRYVEGSPQNGTRPSAVSYNAFALTSLPISSEPPGAQLNLTELHSSCENPPLNGNLLYKLNPNVTRQKDDLIELVYPSNYEGVESCNTKWLIWSSECDGGWDAPALWGPKNSGVTDTTASYTCGDTNIQLSFNACNGTIETVECNDVVTEASTEPPYFQINVEGESDPRVEAITNAGPFPGVVACFAGGEGVPAGAVLSGATLWVCD